MSIDINGKNFHILIPSSDISKKVKDLGKQITRDYRGKDLIIIGVLKGGVIFLSDLVRQIDIKADIDFIRVSSYKDGMEAGEIEIYNDIKTTIKDRDVLIVEDLLDTGTTLDFIMKEISSKDPASIKICTLIKKNKKDQLAIDIDYCGFEIEDNFIVGYGTDYAEQGRNLADIYVIEH